MESSPSSTMRPAASSAGSLWQPHQCQTQPLGYLHRLLRIGYWFYVLVVDTLESLLTWSARTANKPRPRCRLRSFVPGVSYKYDHAAATPATLEGWYPLDCMRRRRMMGVAVHMHIQTTHKSPCLHILDISSSLPGDPRCRFGLPRVCGSTRATCRVWGSPGKPAPIAIFVLLVFTSINHHLLLPQPLLRWIYLQRRRRGAPWVAPLPSCTCFHGQRTIPPDLTMCLIRPTVPSPSADV